MWPFRLWRWRFEIQQAADFFGFEPGLVAAIIDRESLGGEALTPPTRLGRGDGNHGHGLMQIDDRAHPDFCSDIEKWGNAQLNIMKGTEILKWGFETCGHHIEGAVATYNSGWARVKDGIVKPWIRELYQRKKPELPTIDELDVFTTGHDYVSDVMARFERLKKVQFT